MTIKRGEIVLANLEPTMGAEQGKIRPCLVIQNDTGNSFSSTTIVAAITSKKESEKEYPFMVHLSQGEGNLPKDSIVLCNQIRTISIEDRILKKIGILKPETMIKVGGALKNSLALD